MVERHSIIIMHESAKESWLADASTYVLIMALVGTGVVVGSTVLQWIGAVIAAFTLLALASNANKRMTIAEARKYLDELESK